MYEEVEEKTCASRKTLNGSRDGLGTIITHALFTPRTYLAGDTFRCLYYMLIIRLDITAKKAKHLFIKRFKKTQGKQTLMCLFKKINIRFPRVR